MGTDAPLTSSQLNLVARRAALGMARTGTIGDSSSGDIFLAFSTAKADDDEASETLIARALPKSKLNPVFRATVEATDEAIFSALVAARDMDGVNGNKAYAIPHDRLRDVMKKYNRLQSEQR